MEPFRFGVFLKEWWASQEDPEQRVKSMKALMVLAIVAAIWCLIMLTDPIAALMHGAPLSGTYMGHYYHNTHARPYSISGALIGLGTVTLVSLVTIAVITVKLRRA